MRNLTPDLAMSPATRQAVQAQLRRVHENIVAAARDMRRMVPIVQKANADFARAMRLAWEAWQKGQRR